MRRVRWLLSGAIVLGFSWWEGDLSRDATSARLSVLISIAFMATVTAWGGRRAQRMTTLQWLNGPLSPRHHLISDPATTWGAIVWVSLVAAVVGWNLYSFSEQRHDLPTLSRLIGHVTGQPVGRAGVFGLWLVLGAVLALGWRRR